MLCGKGGEYKACGTATPGQQPAAWWPGRLATQPGPAQPGPVALICRGITIHRKSCLRHWPKKLALVAYRDDGEYPGLYFRSPMTSFDSAPFWRYFEIFLLNPKIAEKQLIRNRPKPAVLGAKRPQNGHNSSQQWSHGFL